MQQLMRHVVLGLAMLTSILWLELVASDTVLRVAEFLLAWTLFSSLVVGGAGAWVAYGRSRREDPGAMPQRDMAARPLPVTVLQPTNNSRRRA